MRPLVPTQASSPANPVLDVWTPVAGMLKDPFSVQYQVYEIATAAHEATPKQIFPSTPGNWATVDLVADRLGTGHFVGRWTVPADEHIGRHEVVWSVKALSSSTAVVWRQEFDVVAAIPRSGVSSLYALVADLRDEGVTTDDANDRRAVQAIGRASRQLEAFTGRFFDPRYAQLTLDGHGRNALLFDDPVIAIELIAIKLAGIVAPDDTVTPESYRIYNRHLTQRLNRPDDRESPKVEFVDSYGLVYPSLLLSLIGRVDRQLIWPKGAQNVQVNGIFGYTDPSDSGNPVGQTPELVRRATVLLALREIPQLSDPDRQDIIRAPTRTLEATRDQSTQYNPSLMAGSFTGDYEIDQALAELCRPPSMGAT